MCTPRASASTSSGCAYSRSIRSRTRRSHARSRRCCAVAGVGVTYENLPPGGPASGSARVFYSSQSRKGVRMARTGAVALLAAAALAWVGPARPAQAKPPGAAAAQAYRAGLTAYTHAYPAIMHRLSQRTFPVNALVSIDALSTPADRLVVLPNVDTVYSVGKLDLRAGPLVVHVPAMDDRYFVLQLMDAYTDVVGYLGSRTTGPGPRDTIIVGPHDRTPLPAGMPVLRSPTDD